MAIKYYPRNGRDKLEFVRSFRPSGSQTVFWPKDVGMNSNLLMLKWGGEFFLPVYDGLKLGLTVHNGNPSIMGYPTYLERANLWDGGPDDENRCPPEFMWEVKPGYTQVFDKMVSPFNQVGRPLIITPGGFGNSIGEGTFGTNMFHGQVRVFEKRPILAPRPATRGSNVGQTRSLGLDTERGGFHEEAFSFDFGVKGNVKGFDAPRSVPDEPVDKGRASIGLGDEEAVSHYDTGVRYQNNAQPVISLHVEYRSDLEAMLQTEWPWMWNWDWPYIPYSGWWDEPWNFGPTTAPNIPSVSPRKPNGGWK